MKDRVGNTVAKMHKKRRLFTDSYVREISKIDPRLALSYPLIVDAIYHRR